MGLTKERIGSVIDKYLSDNLEASEYNIYDCTKYWLMAVNSSDMSWLSTVSTLSLPFILASFVVCLDYTFGHRTRTAFLL